MMIDVNDFVAYVLPLMFWLGFMVGMGAGLLVSAIIAVTFLLKGE